MDLIEDALKKTDEIEDNENINDKEDEYKLQDDLDLFKDDKDKN